VGKSAKKSTKNFETDVRIEVVNGMQVCLTRTPISKRLTSFILRENEIARIKPDAIQGVRELTPEEHEAHDPKHPDKPPVSDDAPDDVKTEVQKQWDESKVRFEKEQAELGPLKHVSAFIPIYDVTKVEVDDKSLRVFHTVRGPILGMVLKQTQGAIELYSPCFIDPNVKVGRIHYIPIAFAGYRYTLYQHTCLGESTPDESIALGYPNFVAINRSGDYQYRGKGAYHDIEADIIDDSKTVQSESPVRDALKGLLMTSDVAQIPEVEKRTAMEEAVEAHEAETPPEPPKE
jgi:hypothetical protein